MKSSKVAILFAAVCAVVLAALFLIEDPLGWSHRHPLQGVDSLRVAENPQAQGAREEGMTDSEYYSRTLEATPGEEYAPAQWTAAAVTPLPVPTNDWPGPAGPSVSELPDTLRWDYFRPERNRPFTRQEKQFLAERGFFTEQVPAGRVVEYDDMIDWYNSIRILDFGDDYTTVPVFITSDLLLHVYHVTFDRALQQAEERKLYFLVKQLTRQMYEGFARSAVSGGPQLTGVAARKNRAFFGVALALLDTTFTADSSVKDIVDGELNLIRQAAGVSPSPLTSENQDYTQYIVRGHYTKNQRLHSYFQAMMWYARTQMPVDSVTLTAMAIQQARVLERSGTLNLWKRLSNIYRYLVGAADDITPVEYTQLDQDLFSSAGSSLEVPSPDELSRFMARANALPVPQIADRSVRGPHGVEPTKRSYRFFGQRFTPDAAFFTALTSPRVGTDDRPRNMPTALDVMSVFGSPVAKELLLPQYSIPGYQLAVEKLTADVGKYPAETWSSSVYMSWLNTLMSLLPEKGNGFPFFARGHLWATKSLVTALASWTELKHDTILLSKQSGAEMGEGGEGPPLPPQPKSYVEPDLAFFNRFVDLLQTSARAFSDNSILSEEYLRKFSMYFDHVVRLRSIVENELQNRPITHDEYKFMIDFSADIEGIVLPQDAGDIVDDTYKQMALVADVHTDFLEERALEEGVGAPRRIYVAVNDSPGGARVCVGYVYTYYEFTQPIDRRLTDEAWKGMVYREVGGKPSPDPALRSYEPSWVHTMELQ